MTYPMAPLKNDDKDSDRSLAEVLKIAKEQKKEKEAKMLRQSITEADENVEKLVGLLNRYAHWEIRGLLVSVLQDNKVDVLKVRLVDGGRPDTANAEEVSNSSDTVGQQFMAGENAPEGSSNYSAFTNGHRARQRSRDDLGAPTSLRRSTSVSRRREVGRSKSLVRSHSDDKKLVAMIAQKDSEGLRQAAILAKRRDLDKVKNDTRKKGGLSPMQLPSRRVKRSLTPPRGELNASNHSNSPTKVMMPHRSLGKTRSGSADNLLGSSSMHAAGRLSGGMNHANSPSKVMLPHRSLAKTRGGSADNLLGSSSMHTAGRASGGRGMRNATFKSDAIGRSVHGTSIEQSLTARRLVRTHSLRGYGDPLDDVPSPESVARVHSARQFKENARHSTAFEGMTAHRLPAFLDSEEQSKTSFTKNSAGDESTVDGSDTEFLQFHPGPEDKQVGSFRRAKVDILADEKKTSASGPFKNEAVEASTSKKRDSVEMVKKSLKFFLRKPNKYGAVGYGDDEENDEESDCSDVESTG